MGHFAVPASWLKPRTTGGEGGLKWQCSAPLISTFSNCNCYHLCPAMLSEAGIVLVAFMCLSVSVSV